ncbi:MAG: protein-L-isoaspartate O-methyltransferase [Paracoccaceae bacterium]
MTDFSFRRTMMVDTQVRPNDVTKFPIIEAMLAVPREAFVPHDRQEAAYVGENLDIAAGRVMFEPRTLAKMLDAMDVQKTDRVLVVGCGYGYSAAVLGRMAASVVALEAQGDLAEAATGALAGQANVTVRVGALGSGAAADGPFDKILVEGAVELMPAEIEAQLSEGGAIGAVFMTGALGVARIGHKVDGRVNWRFGFNAAAPVLEGFHEVREFRF